MKKMKLFARNTLGILMAAAIFFSSTNLFTVSAATSTPENVSVSRPGYGIVTVSSGSLNVRVLPSTDSTIIEYLYDGDYIMIVGKSGDFYQVQYDINGNYGYVYKDFVTFVSKSYYLIADTESTNLNMRSSNNTSSKVIAKIPSQKNFAYYTNYGTWYQGVYGNVKGFVSAQYTEIREF